MSAAKPLILLLPGHKTRAVLTKSVKHRDVAQLVHITDETPRTRMFDLPGWLRDDGYEVYIAQYQNDSYHTPSIGDLASWLSVQIEKLALLSQTGTIIIIAHSLGGLITRACVDDDHYSRMSATLGRSPVEKAFLIGTPHQGTGFRKMLQLALDFTNSPHQIACQEMSSTTFMKEFNRRYTHYNSPVPYFVIGGKKVNTVLGHLFSAYIWLTQRDVSDGIFTVENTTDLPGKYLFAVVDACHEPPLGNQYFEATPHGNVSETYKQCIQPVLQHENKAAFTNQRPEKRPQSYLYLLFAPFFFACIFTVLVVRFIRYRLLPGEQNFTPSQTA